MAKLPGRREFLYLVVITGAAAGCSRASSQDDLPSTSAPLIITATPPVTLAVDLRFELENGAINYHPNPEGCKATTIKGAVRNSAGAPVPQVTVNVWVEGDVQQVISLTTDQSGVFTVDIETGLTDKTYNLQLVADGGGTLLSDVVVAQAIPSCDLNLIEVNFVAAPG